MEQKRKLTKRQAFTVEGVAQGKSLHKAALDAGYSPHTAKSMPYKPLENTRILEAVGKRKAEALRNAQIDTAVIVGSLAEIATASLADVLDENGDFSIKKARENGVDHLIKRLEKTNTKRRTPELRCAERAASNPTARRHLENDSIEASG